MGTVGTVLGGFRSPGERIRRFLGGFCAEGPAGAGESAGAEELAGAGDIAGAVANSFSGD